MRQPDQHLTAIGYVCIREGTNDILCCSSYHAPTVSNPQRDFNVDEAWHSLTTFHAMVQGKIFCILNRQISIMRASLTHHFGTTIWVEPCSTLWSKVRFSVYQTDNFPS